VLPKENTAQRDFVRMSKLFMVMAIILVILSSSAMGESKKLVLISPGHDLPVIALGPKADRIDRFAADELQSHLNKMTGRKLEIVDDDEVGQKKYIAIGASSLTTSINKSTLVHEQFIIHVSPEGVAIVGGDAPELQLKNLAQNGTLYGVYDVLENLGVRWYRPEPWGEHVPHRETVTLPIGRRKSKVPVFKMRSGGGYGFGFWQGGNPTYKEQIRNWRVRNRLTGNYPYSFGHSYSRYIPAEKYYAEHPEYFALVNGKRDPVYQLCLGNPEVQELFAQNVIAYARKNPDLSSISVEPDDGDPLCECQLCKAMDDPESRSSRITSDRVSKFANIMARKLATEIPGMKVHWYAYSGHTSVPRTISKLEKNTIVQLCSINEWGDYSKPFMGRNNGWNQNSVQALREWGELEPHGLMMYSYGSGYGWPGPLPIVRAMADRFRQYRRLNVMGVYNETMPHWGTQGLELYMFPRLAWNPDLNLDRELNLFYRNYYGPAAVPMKAYHEIWMKTLANYPLGMVTSGGRGMHLFCTPSLIESLGVYMRSAERRVRDKPLYERRLKGVQVGYEIACRVSAILEIKKSTGRQVDITEGAFAGRGSYLKSAEAERMYEELAHFILNLEIGDVILDQDPEIADNIVINKMREDILENSIYTSRGHEIDLLKDY